MEIKKLKPYLYEIKGKTSTYECIVRKDGTWFCSCPAYRFISTTCKHIEAVKLEVEKEQFENAKLEAQSQFDAELEVMRKEREQWMNKKPKRT